MIVIKKERPLSPHLAIYNEQITSSLSIYHRISGVFLSLFIFAFLIIPKLNTFIDVNCIFFLITNNMYQFLDYVIFSGPGKGIILMLFFIFFYHNINGFRHMLWDITCFFLSNRWVNTTGKFVINSTYFWVFVGLLLILIGGYKCNLLLLKNDIHLI